MFGRLTLRRSDTGGGAIDPVHGGEGPALLVRNGQPLSALMIEAARGATGGSS